MAKLLLTKRQRKELKRPGQPLTLVDFVRVQLTAKEVKHYRKLIIAKLELMNVKDEVQMQATGKVRIVKYFDQKEMKIKTARLPLNRLANLQKSLTKRLLKLSKSEVERFLAQDFSEAETKPAIEVDANVSSVQADQVSAGEA